MTMIAVTVLPILCALLIAVLFGRRMQLVRSREQLVEYRIALDFVREEHADMPHEFAAIWLAGNSQAMEQKFPDFFVYRNACLSSQNPEYAQ